MRKLACIVLAATAGCAPPPPAARQPDEAADRAAIHALLVAYGATLDARDFEGFGALFGSDGVYVAGGGTETRGGAAAAELMRRIFSANAAGYREPNYHVFFNEVVTLDGAGKARASSMSFYMAPDEQGRPIPVLMARYEDQLVREDGRWRFARRAVSGLIPGPANPRPPAAD